MSYAKIQEAIQSLFMNSKVFYRYTFPIALISTGIILGVAINFTSNKTLAPGRLHAAANPTATLTPTPKPSPTPAFTPTPSPTPSYKISGKLFIDINGNGKHNAEESDYTPGATVSASINGSTIATTTSSNLGKYTFSGLQNGSYSIALKTPDKYSTTTPNPIEETINNADITSVDFGLFPNDWTTKSNDKTLTCSDLHQFVKDHCGN